jgi:hypothetical protein
VVALVFQEEKFCGSTAGGRKASDAATRLNFQLDIKGRRIQIKRSSFRLFSAPIHSRSLLPSPSLNIYRFNFSTPNLIIHLIEKIKYILKLHYIINYIIVKIHNNCKKFNKKNSKN